MTDKKIYTPTRVAQGSTDAALHFQATVEKVLAPLLHKNLLVWIDDLLLFVDTVDELVSVMQRIFKLLDQHGVKLNLTKCELFLKDVKWCGRIVSATGIGHDPERIEALQKIPYLNTAAELQQFVCATNWLREDLVDYARVDWKLTTPIQEQKHELLICMGGAFKESQLNWTVLEKEMYPIVHACDKLEYLLLRAQGFKIDCDHRNIMHLFAPGKE
ncbi:unnamed protein product [Globisporangium polare]